jgi:hypothetical protein
MHEIVEQVTIAFNRLAYENHDYPERDCDVTVVGDYLAMIGLHCAGLESAHAHELGEAQKWFRLARELDDQLRVMRTEVAESRAEVGAICIAAQTLFDQLAAGADAEAVARAGEDLRQALTGERTATVRTYLGESVRKYDALKIVSKMLRKMKAGPRLSSAAESWVRQKLQM